VRNSVVSTVLLNMTMLVVMLRLLRSCFYPRIYEMVNHGNGKPEKLGKRHQEH